MDANKTNNYWGERSLNFNDGLSCVLFKRFPESLNQHIHSAHKEIIFENIPKQSKEKILDMGCGYGRITMELTKSDPGIDIFGLDISSVFVDLYKKNTNKPAQVATLEKFPENVGKFDYIICIAVLMYVEKNNINSAIQNLFNHLNDNGKIILIEPLSSGKIFLSGFGLLTLFSSKNKISQGYCFKSKEIKKLIINNGGKIIEEKRTPVTTFFIIPIYLIAKIFNRSKLQVFFKIVRKLDKAICHFKLPSMHTALIITKNKEKKQI